MPPPWVYKGDLCLTVDDCMNLLVKPPWSMDKPAPELTIELTIAPCFLPGKCGVNQQDPCRELIAHFDCVYFGAAYSEMSGEARLPRPPHKHTHSLFPNQGRNFYDLCFIESVENTPRHRLPTDLCSGTSRYIIIVQYYVPNNNINSVSVCIM